MKSESKTTTKDALWENKYLEYLHFIATIVGLSIPNLYSYRGLSIWYLFYTIGVIALTLTMFVIALKKWVDFFEVKLLGTIIVLNCMCLAIMTLSNITSTVFSVIVKRKKVVQLVEQLKSVDAAIRGNEWVMGTDKNFGRVFLGLHFCILLKVSMETIFYTSAFGAKSLILEMLNSFLVYIHTINVLQISSFPLRINHRCACLNEILHNLLETSQKATQLQDIHKVLDDMRLLLKIYDAVCDMFEDVNRCFGIQMILVVCVTIIFIVEGFNTCIKFSLKKIHLVHKEHEYPLLFLNLCSCLAFAVSDAFK